MTLLIAMKEFSVNRLIFSSSCTVYGQPDRIPVTEQSQIKPAESPYGSTKQMGEEIIENVVKASAAKAILLRYFNPVGAHPSILIGELPLGKPANLVPAITQTAIGKLPQMTVFGNDYDTPDGSCIRDYIHVSDIAHAHTLALQYLINGKNETDCDVFNLGTGNGVTVLQAIKTFEEISGKQLNYQIGPRRPGDVIAIYANNDYAVNRLGWQIKYDIKEMMRTAWQWELKVKEDEEILKNQQFQLN